ncbi:hypothetical protein ACT691_20655 [Vibrio metschnikovii]
MSTFMNNISPQVYVNAVEEDNQKAQAKSASSSVVDDIKPNQPLPGSAISLNALWRLVEEQMKEVANAISGTGKENSAAKNRSLIYKKIRKSIS